MRLPRVAQLEVGQHRRRARLARAIASRVGEFDPGGCPAAVNREISCGPRRGFPESPSSEVWKSTRPRQLIECVVTAAQRAALVTVETADHTTLLGLALRASVRRRTAHQRDKKRLPLVANAFEIELSFRRRSRQRLFCGCGILSNEFDRELLDVGGNYRIRRRRSRQPWRKALRLDRRLPSAVAGPVLFAAFRRLAAICLSEVIATSRSRGAPIHPNDPLQVRGVPR
jgi:hypothetical protein